MKKKKKSGVCVQPQCEAIWSNLDYLGNDFTYCTYDTLYDTAACVMSTNEFQFVVFAQLMFYYDLPQFSTLDKRDTVQKKDIDVGALSAI